MGHELVGKPPIEAAVAVFIRASQADNTQRAYAADWRAFETWCLDNRKDSLPADPLTVAAYLAALAENRGRKLSTIRRRCAAIAHMHRSNDYESPTSHAGVKATLNGIARTLGARPAKKAALTVELVARTIRKVPTDVLGLRDRALLLLGFAGAFRRSELVAIDVTDIARHARGLVVTIGRSKTDQLGAGMVKAIPHGKRLRVAEAIDAWLIAARIVDGPVFRALRGQRVLPTRLTARQVARIVKKRAAAAGLDPALFAGHSLRSGFLTSADDHGASLTKAADHAGHKKLDTTRGYMQTGDAFRDHAGKKFL